ncbi:MAG: hypothetical protein IJM18_01290, partial [Clostridia bacterium]|nr:hypothetical protein [Clostridia bacterium]
YEYLREHAGEIAKELADNNVKFVFYIDGTEIISQRIVFKDGSFGVDHLKDKEEERFYIFEDNEGDLSVLDVRNDISDKNRLKGTAVASYIQSGSGSSESQEIGTCVYDFDKTKESVIGTYEGSARINVQGQEIVTVTVTQDGDTMKHEIVINAETFSDQLKTLTIRIDASEGKKIEAPSVPPTDLSGKSAEEISRIFENMFSQLQQVLTDALM